MERAKRILESFRALYANENSMLLEHRLICELADHENITIDEARPIVKTFLHADREYRIMDLLFGSKRSNLY